MFPRNVLGKKTSLWKAEVRSSFGMLCYLGSCSFRGLHKKVVSSLVLHSCPTRWYTIYPDVNHHGRRFSQFDICFAQRTFSTYLFNHNIFFTTFFTYRCVTWSTGGRLTTPYMIAGFEKTKRGVRISPLGGRFSWWGRLAQHGVASYCALHHNPPQPHVMPSTHSCYALLVFYPLINDFFCFFAGFFEVGL